MYILAKHETSDSKQNEDSSEDTSPKFLHDIKATSFFRKNVILKISTYYLILHIAHSLAHNFHHDHPLLEPPWYC